MAADVLDILLVEDNPGDARYIEELLRSATDHLHRIDLDGSTPERSRLHHEPDLAAGIEHLTEADPDVILLDLGLPDSVGLDTLVSVVEETTFTPVVVLTGLDDRDLGIRAIQSGAQDYLVKAEVTGELLVHSIQNAIERARRERERVRHRQRLESLNRLNRISHDVTHAVITTSGREDLERAVCERLVEPDAYRFAWIGGVDRSTGRLSPRTSAGVEEGSLEDVTVSIDDGATVDGPVASAVDTRAVQVVGDVRTDPAFEAWRAPADERGYRSVAAVPIVHEGVLYGILAIYAGPANAFSEAESDVLSRLGHVVGHAITAIERRDALVSDTVLEFEFRVEGVAEELVARSANQGWTLEIGGLVRGDDALLAYGRADGVPREELREVAARTAAIDDLRILSSGATEYEFELVSGVGGPLVGAVATHGGTVTSVTIDEGEGRFVVEFPPGRDRRRLVDLVEAHCPGAVPRAQRTVERRHRDVAGPATVVEDRLTAKQRLAIETAYFAGYFEWPRASTGEEIADRLGITAATLSQHLRAAEQKLVAAAFEDESDDVRTAPSSWTSLESGAKND